jgi:hypothetical protein
MPVDSSSERTVVGRTKGMGWTDQIRCYERIYGRDKLLAAVRAMPERWRHGLNEDHPVLGVLEGSWYPELQRYAFFDAILHDLLPLQQQHLAKVMAKEVMDRSLRGLHRMVFAVIATPERFAKHAQSLWSMHHDSGRLEVRMPSPASLEAVVLDSPVHHPFACMLNHYACVVTLEAMGCKDVTERRICAYHERGVCTGMYYWRSS